MIAIPGVDENTDLVELRKTLRDAAIEASLLVRDLVNAEGVMIADGDIPASPMIGNTGFRDLLSARLTLGRWKVIRARLVVKFAIKAAIDECESCAKATDTPLELCVWCAAAVCEACFSKEMLCPACQADADADAEEKEDEEA